MEGKNFTASIVVEQSPAEVFEAIKNVRGWWSEEIEGGTERLNDIFNYHFEDVHRCKIQIDEMIADRKISWHILENYFKPSVVKDRTEWIDTRVLFEIVQEGEKTKLVFTHVGLVPAYECYEICKDGWTQYITQSLYKLITTGKGLPNKTGRATTIHEKKFQR